MQKKMGITISEIKIKGLFGHLNHTIPLGDHGVTFIHGPNGCGKTTVLSLIDALFNWDIEVLFETNYSSIELKHPDQTVFLIEKKSKDIDTPEKHTNILIFKYQENRFELDRRDVETRMTETEMVWAYDEISKKKVEMTTTFSHYKTRNSLQSILPNFFISYSSQINLHFVKTQRLLNLDHTSRRYDETESLDTIQIYSTEMRKLIYHQLTEQATVSQKFDRSFPERFLSMKETVSEEQIRIRYKEIEEKLQKLVAAGLIGEQENISLPNKQMEDAERKLLHLYLEDINEKFQVFEDLQRKIEVFLDVVNSKLKTKKFSVNRTDGFCIKSPHNNIKLSPSQLSSGEQHQIVLFYELIFKAKGNSFFLIDEPEISLHVDWQRRFLQDIRTIAALGDRHFLIATHSPQIIGSHRDLAVALDAGVFDD